MTDKDMESQKMDVASSDDSFSSDDASGSWHGDLPPEDDFSDDSAAIVDEEMEQAAEDAQQQTDVAAAARKKGTMVVLASLLGGGALIAILLYVQFMATPDNGEIAMPIAAAMQNAQPPSNQESAALTKNPQQKDEADLSSIYNAGLSQTVSPGSSAALALPQPEAMDLKKPATADIQSSEVVTASIQPAPALQPLPTAEADKNKMIGEIEARLPPLPAKTIQETAPAHPVIAAAPIPAPNAAPNPAPNSIATQQANRQVEERLKGLESRIDDLRKSMEHSLDQATKLAHDIEKKPAQPQDQDMAARISALESKIAALSVEKQKPSKQKEPREEQPTPQAQISPAIAVQEPVPPEELIVKERVAPKAKEKKQAVKKEQPKESVAKQKWVLRAATPDSAWIAPDASSSELKQIQVGDTVPGIGRVKAIKQSGENWVVVGSKASVR